MNELFNTAFEVSLRVLLILNVARDKLSLEKITAFDFIANYGTDFEVSDYNLHGNNRLRFSEYTVRREKVNQGIKDLVLIGYVLPCCSKEGFTYCLTENGRAFCRELNNEYATKYSNMVNMVLSEYGNFAETELINKINHRAIAMFGGK